MTSSNGSRKQDRLEQVLQLAELGFRLHPLIAGGKKPVVNAWPLEATSDPDIISRWYRVDPERNWGAAMGKGMLAIDIDVKNGDGEASWKKLVGKRKVPKTVEAVTPTNGRHLVFSYPEEKIIGNSVGTLAPHIDVRADGGYIAIAPTTTDKGEYRWVRSPLEHEIAEAPTWLIKAIEESSPKNVEWPPIGGDLENGNRNNTIFHHVLNLAKLGTPIDMAMGVVDKWLKDNGINDMSSHEISATVQSAYKHAAKKMKDNGVMREYLLSDAGNGDRFYDLHKEDAVYVPEFKQWYLWNGKYWEVDMSGKVFLLAEEMFKALIVEALEIQDDERRRKVITHAINSTNQTKLKAAVQNAEPKMMLSATRLDTCRHKVNVQNGTLNLDTRELEPFSPEDYMTKILDFEYDPDAECTHFMNWLVWAFAGDMELVKYMQYVVGRSLFGNPAKEAIFIYGPRDTGKTTMIHVIDRLSGPYGQKFKIELLLNLGRARDANDASPELAKLFGARFAVSSEMPPNGKLNEALFKDITGRDTISARQLHEKAFTFQPQFTLWMVGNDRPKIRAEDEAAFSRMRVVPFKVKVLPEDKNPNLVTEVFEPELPGILRWAFEGAVEAHHELKNNVPIPDAVKKEVAEYKKEVDPVAQFLDEDPLVESPGAKVDTKRVYSLFSRFMMTTFGVKFNPISSVAFTRQVVKILECDTHRSNGLTHLLGYDMNKDYEMNNALADDW